MLIQPAEESFQRGVQLLSQGKIREALAFFNGAVEIERRFGADRPQARYLSYYGLCLSETRGDQHAAVRACREAMALEGYRPEVCWNLGQVLLNCGKRSEAYQALQRGLKMQPGHPGILRDLRRMGKRRPPVLPFLERSNPLNVMLGKMLRGKPARPAQPQAAQAVRATTRIARP